MSNVIFLSPSSFKLPPNFMANGWMAAVMRAVFLFFIGLFSLSCWAEGLEQFSLPAVQQQPLLFTIQGSNTIGAHLGPSLVSAYLAAKGASDITVIAADNDNEVWVQGSYQHIQVRVRIDAHGSGTGFKGLATARADIAAASRPIKDKEAALLQHIADMRSAKSEHIVGIDGLAIIVHPNNPISDLSVAQLADVFSGKITDWSELNGLAGPIHIYARDNQSGTWDSFRSMVLGKQHQLVASAQRFESNDALSDSVSVDPLGIGFVALSSVRQSKLLAVSDGSAKPLQPNKLTVATEDYALSRRLYLYTDDDSKNTHVNEFIAFSQSDAGQKIVANSGFVSQEPQALLPEFYAELPQDFRQLTAGAKRLTINFRFHQGSATLDNKAMADLSRLVDFLQGKDGSEVILIGFSDEKRTEERSELLSKLRAMAVRRELVKLGGIYPHNSVGYGIALPVASGNRKEGQIKNRRVEVWLREPAELADSNW